MSEEVCTLCSPVQSLPLFLLGSEEAVDSYNFWSSYEVGMPLRRRGGVPVYLLSEPSPPIVQKDSTGTREWGHPGPEPPRRLFCGVPEGFTDFFGTECPHSSIQYPVSQEITPWDMKPWLLVMGTEGWVKGSTQPIRWSPPPK